MPQWIDTGVRYNDALSADAAVNNPACIPRLEPMNVDHIFPTNAINSGNHDILVSYAAD